MGKKAVQWRAETGMTEVDYDSDSEGEVIILKKIKMKSVAAGMPMLNVFNTAGPIWHGRYHGKNLNFKQYLPKSDKTVAELMEKATAKVSNIDLDKFAITEVFCIGDGTWRKGTTIPYNSDQAADLLKSFGWDGRRGKTHPPVWLCIHKRL